MASGIYAIIHRESGRWYVGQSQNLRKRFSQHRSRLMNGSHENSRIQNAWNKYGADAFDFEILILAPVWMLDDIEQAYLDDPHTNHYNISKDAAVPARGLKRTAEVRAKMSLLSKGRPISAEHRAKISAAKMGHPVSAETREKLKGARSQETRSRMSEAKRVRSKPGKRLDNTSGFNGVCWHKGAGKWVAQITHSRKHLYLGLFSDPKEAARAYDKKAVEVFGGLASLNFPDEDSH